MKLKILASCILASVATLQSAAVGASEYPDRPIRLVVGYAPGGAADVLARVVADGLSKELGETVTVENRPGAGSTIAASTVARAAPDGYTLGLGTANMYGVDQYLYKAPYTPANFTPITQLTSAPLILAVNNELGVKTVADLAALAKANPGKLNYASSGIGGSPHVAGLMFEKAVGVATEHVPFKGGAPAMTSMIAGDVHFSFGTAASVLPLGKEGRITMLGVSSLEQSPIAPELPTLAESGLPGFEYSFWFGLMGPADLPQPIVEKLYAASKQVLEDPAIQAKFILDGSVATLSASPAAFAEFAQQSGKDALERVEQSGVTLN